MARGTQHRKRRPTSNAAVAQKAKTKSKPVKQDSWEDQLFFPRLRRHAKWVFVLLALAFAFSFVLFGVGSGSTGIGDVMNGFTSIFSGDSSSSSTSKLEKKTREHPNDAQAWRELATALQTKDDKMDEAITALTRYTELRPKNQAALEELAGLYIRRTEDYRQQQAVAYFALTSLRPGSQYDPSTGSPPLSQALQDPLSSGITQSGTDDYNEADAKIREVGAKAVDVFKRLAALNPEDATIQLRMGQAAEQAGQNAEAIAAYTAFLKLAPQDPSAFQVKQRLKQLTATGTASASAG